MYRVEPKLAEWHRLYYELEQARKRLKAEMARPSIQNARTQMQQEVDRLGEESIRALDDAYTELESVLPRKEWEALAPFRPGKGW